MPNKYPLSIINLRLLWSCLISDPLVVNGILKKPTTYNEAYSIYLQEQKFLTLLMQTADNSNIYNIVAKDLSYLRLESALCIWLRPITSNWKLKCNTIQEIIEYTNYSLAWKVESKAFLIATRDFLKIETVTFDARAIEIQQQEAHRCAKLLFLHSTET
jgi:hypothetical protein